MDGTKAQMMKALIYEGSRMMNVREEPVPVAGVGEVMVGVEILCFWNGVRVWKL